MLTVTSITMDFHYPWHQSDVYIVQDDSESRHIECYLYDNGEAWVVPNGITAELHAMRPDKTRVTVPCTITDNKIEVVIDDRLSSVPGLVKAEITLEDGSGSLSTFQFNIHVFPRV